MHHGSERILRFHDLRSPGWFVFWRHTTTPAYMRVCVPRCSAPRLKMFVSAIAATVACWLCFAVGAAALESDTALAALLLLVFVTKTPLTTLKLVAGGGACGEVTAPCTWSAAGVLCGVLLLAQVAPAATGQPMTSQEELRRVNVLVQYGQTRTASTFQTKLLELVGRLRAVKSGRTFATFFNGRKHLGTFLDRECNDTMFCLVKTHVLQNMSAAEKTALFGSGRVFLFTSRQEDFVFADNIASLVKHEQLYHTFLKESLYDCVAHYQPIFDLSDDEVLYTQVCMFKRDQCCARVHGALPQRRRNS